jgi:anti-sigma regulatory factor (Ser/Thr protein kinase)
MLAEAEVAPAGTRSFVPTATTMSEPDDWIERMAAAWSVGADVVFRARVCVAEVAANLLEHGRVRPEGDEMTVTLRPDGAALDIVVNDTGRAFDPTARSERTATLEGLGGRGLRLLHAYATVMSYRRDRGHNILRIRVAPGQHGTGGGSPP